MAQVGEWLRNMITPQRRRSKRAGSGGAPSNRDTEEADGAGMPTQIGGHGTGTRATRNESDAPVASAVEGSPSATSLRSSVRKDFEDGGLGGKGHGAPIAGSLPPQSERTDLSTDALRTLQHQKAAMEAIIRQQEIQIAQKGSELNDLELGKQSLSATINEWQDKYERLERCLADTKTKASAAIRQREEKLGQVGRESRELREELVDVRRQLGDMEGHVARRDESLRNLKTLLDSRSEELKVAQSYLTTADQHSVADVSRMVEELNEEIFQCTMTISDALVDRGGQGGAEADERMGGHKEDASRRLERRWGGAIVTRLQEDVGQGDTLLFESLIQNTLAILCHDIIRSFTLESQEFENRCQAMWDGIMRTYDTPVAKKWLSMTQSQLKYQRVDHFHMVHEVVSHMVAAGWIPEKVRMEALESKIQGALEDLTAGALRIKEAITEGILSVDSCSEALRGTSPEEAKGDIICSTALGVQCIKRQGHQRTVEGHEWRTEVVLKAKVLLVSSLEPSNE